MEMSCANGNTANARPENEKKTPQNIRKEWKQHCVNALHK